MLKGTRRKTFFGYLFIAPWLMGFLCFTAFPLFSNIYLSFTNWKLVGSTKFIGLDNYKNILFNDTIFWICLKNTFEWVIFSNLLVLVFALIIAVLLSNDFKGNYILRTLIYIPSILPPIAFGVVIGFIFSGSPNSLSNQLLHLVGISPQGWFQNPKLSLPTAISSTVWFVGTPMLIYLAAIKAIPKSYYEAAKIDGATFLSKLIHITIPLISQAVVFNLVMGIINGWQVYDSILPFTTASTTDISAAYGRDYSLGVMLIHIHEKAFRQFQLGYASALGMILFCIVVIFTMIFLRFIYKSKRYHQEFQD